MRFVECGIVRPQSELDGEQLVLHSRSPVVCGGTRVYPARVVSKEVDQPLTQDELNALGKDGWELVGIVPLLNTVQFYLKRIRG
jgi:hypothetical protein